MKKIMAFLTCLFLIILLFSCGKANGDGSSDIEVMSFNIRYGLADDGEDNWQYRKDYLCDLIRNESPDIIGLQEALRFQIDEIQRQLPGYDEIGIGRDGGEKGEYSAILFRRDHFIVSDSGTFWLSDTPNIPSASWGNYYLRICTWGHFQERVSKKYFYLFNTHLDHQSQTAREKGVQLIMREIKRRKFPDPVILGGDFNAAENNTAILYLKNNVDTTGGAPLTFKDSYRVVHRDAEIVGTFNGFRGSTEGDKIDYIFISPGFEVLDAEIIRKEHKGRYPSDHFPLTARVRLHNSSLPD